jgi:ABC-type Fe3+ transport system permease subunit
MKYLDYIYYRVTKAYMKWDGETGITGIMAVSLIVSMLFIDLYGVIHLAFFFEKYGNQDKDLGKPIILVLMLLITITFYIRYRKQYKELKTRWANETKDQRLIRGFLVILAILLPILLPVLYLSLFR